MKVHRFFIDQKLDGLDEIKITEEATTHQMRNVLRLRVDDPIVLFNGTGIELHGRVKDLTKNFSIISKEKIEKKDLGERKIKLYSALIKKDKYEWVLQKGTELGVSQFTPIITKRTEKIKLNMDRADKIIKEAGEQSERVDLPEIQEPISLKEAIEEAVENCETGAIAFDRSGISLNDYNLIEGDISLFIGPEGGFDVEELEMFKEKGIDIVSLGSNILRAETAAIVAPAIVNVEKLWK